jgi:hypothetical protein
MPLSCSCDSDGDYEWYYYPPEDYREAPLGGNRKRCKSCKAKIAHGSVCVEFECSRSPNNDIEERIYGDAVQIASLWHCERCADLYFSLRELGFTCIGPEEDLRELVKEYAETYQP